MNDILTNTTEQIDTKIDESINVETKDTKSQQIRDMLSNYNDLKKKEITLSDFDIFYTTISTKVDTSNNLLRQHKNERDELIKQINNLKNDPNYAADLKAGFIKLENLNLFTRVIQIDSSFIIPHYELIRLYSILGFQRSGKLVDVNKTLQESKIFTEYFDKMLKTNDERSTLLIDNVKTFHKSLMDEDKKRTNDYILRLEEKLRNIESQQLILNTELAVTKILKEREKESKNQQKLQESQQNQQTPQQNQTQQQPTIQPQLQQGFGVDQNRFIALENEVSLWHKEHNGNFKDFMKQLKPKYPNLSKEELEYIETKKELVKTKLKPKSRSEDLNS